MLMKGTNQQKCRIICICFFLLICLFQVALAEKLKLPDELSIATAAFPPFKFEDPVSGQITGFDTEIITEVFRSMGITPHITMLPFKRADRHTRKGKYAAYYSFTKNEDREKDYFFSDPISSVQDLIFFNKETQLEWETYEDLAYYRLGYASKYNYDEAFLKAVKKKTPVTHEKNEEFLLSLLSNKRLDMIICEASVCSFLIKNNPEKFGNIIFAPKPVGIPEPRPFYMGFSKKWKNAKELRDAFNIALKAYVRGSENPRKTILKKYGAPCPAALFPECE